MKRLLALIAVAAIAMFATSVYAQPGSAPGSLYMQEGTTADGPAPIDASGQGPANPNWTNWKWQTGSGSWSAIYAPGADPDNAWMMVTEEGDSNVEIEADIEMFCSESISNNKIYFHLGNITAATEGDLTADINGTLVSNNGQYVGINFTGSGKDINDFEKVGGAFTGKIIGGMVSDRDTWRTQNNTMDLQILMTDGISGSWLVPVNYGDGAHNTIHDSLWWLVNSGAPGSYNLTWRVKLLPVAYQPDGDYHLDPTIVCAPVM